MRKYSIILLLSFAMTLPIWAQTAIRRPLQNRGTPQNAPQQTTPLIPTSPVPESQAWNAYGQAAHPGLRNDIVFAPLFKFSMLDDEAGFLAGGKLGWIINHTYLLGLEGYWLVNDVPGPSTATGLRPDLAMKYGGLTLEYIILPQNIIHFSLAALTGIGSVTYDDGIMKENDTYWLVEPSLNVYLNLTEYLQVGLGVGYRHVDDVDVEDLEGQDLSGISATLSLNFGTYGETLIPNR